MDKKYVTPEMEIIEFDTEDVITTSPTVTKRRSERLLKSNLK